MIYLKSWSKVLRILILFLILLTQEYIHPYRQNIFSHLLNSQMENTYTTDEEHTKTATEKEKFCHLFCSLKSM